ncbi:MAG: anthranilate synthase component I [Gammaproteobacteria bacterium]
MSIDRFNGYAAEGYNHIPVTREILADLDTPLSAYMKLATGPRTYLLESVQGGEKWGRYSIIGLSANTVLRVKDNVVTIEVGSKIVSEKETSDPFGEINSFLNQYRVPAIEGLPRFTGGLVGYFGYDCVCYIEPRLQSGHKQDPLGSPDIMLLVSNRIVVFDNVSGKLMIVVHADPGEDGAYEKALHDLDMLTEKLSQSSISNPAGASIRTVNENDFISGFERKDFQQAVSTIKDYIVEGDVMQVVLSQRLSIPFNAPPLNLYRALRCMNPSPYMFYLNFDDFFVVGASPEILIRLEDESVTVRPIAGTRPRGRNEAEDKALELELLADPKELAEHLMLIDLGRNDIGRVTETGTIQLTEKMAVERYSHVMHIVSNVIGKLHEDQTAIDVLRAAFPAGTVSGAPKIRAMEIIDELEPVKRGVYAGAVGYLSWAGNIDTAIAIRTAVIKDNTLHIQVGAGIVADSIPENEWEETMNKGRAIFRAVSMAENGLI